MSRRHPQHTTLPEDLPLLRVLAELAGVLVLVLGVKVADFVRWVVWPETHSPSRPAVLAARVTRPMPPLQWRGPWWAWQGLAWSIATLTAPTFLLVGSLLLVDSKSDHPLFWWSLPVIVAIGNAIAILWINQQHHRKPFTDRQVLARRHVVISSLTGATLFLLVGMVSGFLPDIISAMSSANGAALPILANLLCVVALAMAFSLVSFPFAGTVQACLGFQAPGQWRRDADTGSAPQ